MACNHTTFAVTRFVRYDGGGTLKAFCDVILGDHCLIRGVRIIDGKEGLFVSLPRQLGRSGKWYDSVVLMSKEAKEALTEAVLRAYQGRRHTNSVSGEDPPVEILHGNPTATDA